MTKQIVVNAFAMGCSGLQSPGLWKHPKDQSSNFDTLEYWVDLVKLLEKGKFNALFLADVLSPYDVYDGPGNFEPVAKSGAQFPVIEPSAIISLLASVTKNLSFGITFSTISEAPYHFTRRLATLDHLTKGRVGWNIVTSYLDSSARNLLNNENLPLRTERYERAEEYLQVVSKLLLSSWRDDAVEKNPKTGIYSNPEKIRKINHKGKWFKVPGPSITHPTPQRLPVLLQAGASSEGKDFAARNAEVIFLTNFTPETLGLNIQDIKTIAKEKYGRNPEDLKFLTLVTVIIGDTHEEAELKFQDYKKYGDLEGAQALFSGWTGINIGQFEPHEELKDVGSNAIRGIVSNWTKVGPGEDPNFKKTRESVAKQITVGGLGPVFYGTGEEVADTIARWVDISDVDGFNFTYAVSPGSFEDIVYKLLPILRERGIVWDDYPQKPNGETLTFRENIFGVGEDFVKKEHFAYDLRWRSNESKQEFEERQTSDGSDFESNKRQKV
ncbi:putative monooxygenase [Wickerhamomyces ciferrii]|uniref:Monooxygenase n=1 Tax=Wickerhamomyces ciferrii (strain ATCC 14091 / BCRC 22168 / CBS 111 / JCM 3599 / NBRC 0793 / NRRL Y-1031 F-60-10) TaxID=1206466 RepID=K0KTT7_WICCF|nr:putative monooxygenase [Wickerhamomyces ciferrii]CCH44663.1 putative monooxygenase [Wickerhamomyces ciferrii]